MATGTAGGPVDRRHHLAGHLILAGSSGVVLRAYRAGGGGRAGWANALAALRQAFPAAKANSIGAALRIAREGLECGRRLKAKKPHLPATGVPDARRLIRDARRVK